jgi:hypothetical protein
LLQARDASFHSLCQAKAQHRYSLYWYSWDGCWSRITGYARRGGGKLRKRHGRYVPVAMTNEFRTSHTCSTCFNPIIHPTQRKLVKDKWKKVSNKGTSVCINLQCPRYQAGKSSQNRDKQAAECISISGSSLLLTGKSLGCFDNTSKDCTGQHPMSTATHPLDARQVTVPTVIP